MSQSKETLMKYQTIEISNPGDFIKDGHLGKAIFALEKNGPAIARHLHSVAPCKFDENGIPISWAVTTCYKD